jgi:hypothetical protein
MPCAADYELGIGNETQRHRRQTLEAILADAHECEPFLQGSAHQVTSGVNACGF